MSKTIGNFYSPEQHTWFKRDLEYRRNRIAAIERALRALPLMTFPAKWRFAADTHAALARGWYGKALAALGEANPYPNSTDSTNATIEPAAYRASETFPDLPAGYTESIKLLRYELGELVDRAWKYNAFDRMEICLFRAQHYLEDAKMPLGEELGAIREQTIAQELAVAADR